MGEYATYQGEQIKIGTCEDMYYLRWDQRHAVKPLPGNVNPMNVDELAVIRFRFPWPDEDGIEPGSFKDFERSMSVDGLDVPTEVEHHSIQFSASYPKVGYLLSIPCPEGPGPHPVKVGKNGWGGNVRLTQQALRAGKLVSIFQCGGCNARFRIEDVSELSGMLAELRKRGGFFKDVADRIEVGYYYGQLSPAKQ